MSIDHLPATFAAQYSDLLTSLAELRAIQPELPPGTPTSKSVDGKTYWYVQYARLGKRRHVYLGPDSPETQSRLAALQGAWSELAEERTLAARLVSGLLASDIVPFDGATGRVLEVLDDEGIFRTGVSLVGTNAFVAYQGLLGVRWSSAARTADIDIASTTDVALASPVDLVEALDATGLPFHAIPSLDPRAASTSFKVRRKQLRVDVLVPLVGPDSSTPVEIRGLNVHGMPLRYLDYLIEDPVPVALVCRRGILAQVPQPARFAFHKLLVAASRPPSEQNKRAKDLAQADQLFEVLAEDRPGDVGPAWEALCERGPRWEKKARASAALLSEEARRRAGIEG